MINSFIESLQLEDFIEIFILMLGAFLIGYLFAYFYFKQKLDNIKSNFNDTSINDSLGTIAEGEIKATKTFERGGQEVDENEQLGIEFFVDDEKDVKTKNNDV
jgi:hypothetical protein